MKIDRLIEKTTEKDGVKKWKVVVGIVVGLVLAICIIFSIWVICDVDAYIHDNNQIVALYDFYDSHDYTNETSVYFVGNSQLGYAVYTPEINRMLSESGYNITSYNLFLDGETPNDLLLQLDKIIVHHPSLMIIGYSYRSLLYDSFSTERSPYVSSRINLSDEVKDYLSESELKSLGISSRIDVYRGSLKSTLIGSIDIVDSIKQTYDYEYDPIGDIYRKEWNNQNLISITNSLNQWPGSPAVTDELIAKQDSLIYFIDCLTSEGISVIVLNLPIHPLYSEQISENSRNTYYEFLDSLGVDWYNYENKYDISFFRDQAHANWNGSLEFSHEMAELIIELEESNVIHHS